ncbi:MAG: GDSL-type esterase/lipase family protein [Kiritimatiellae bacterium]|nr:GDSL-type esterase/lipase family protein [Kiritimatiellia bacterium]
MQATFTFLRHLCALKVLHRNILSRAGWVSLCLFLLASPVWAAVLNDYDGDGKSDLALYDENTGYWTVLYSSRQFGSGMQPILGMLGWRPAPGDYDGDGKTDVAIMNKSGVWWMLMSGSNNAPATANFGVAGAGPVQADYDGDGKTDLAYYKKASGAWGILFSDSNQAWLGTWGGPGFIPASADFDGDGNADPCLYQESTGAWYMLLSGSGYLMAGAIWGGPGYQAVPADYDGDEQADLCIYNNTTGEWRILLSGTGYTTYVGIIWGDAAYKPVPGDLDGDGRADLMLYADSIANWLVLLSGSEYSGAGLTCIGTNWSAVKSLWREDLVIMAFGDSITYGGGSSSDGPATGYPKLLETKLKQYYDGYFRVVNRGQDGEDTYQGFERFAQALDATNPNLVLLMEGTNDNNEGSPYDEIEENLRNMIRIALNRGIPVIIATIPPVISNQYQNRSAQMERIMGFNPRIYQIAADLNIPVAPVFEAITAVPGWQSRLMNQPSANHPNDAGYRIVRDTFYTPVSVGLNAGQY